MDNLYESKDDLFLIKKIKEESCSDSLSILIDRHSGICHGVYNKFFASGSSSVDIDEMKAHKDLLIYQAVTTFDENKGTKFSTWLGNLTNYTCLNCCYKKQQYIGYDPETLNFIIDNYNVQEGNENLIMEDDINLDYIREIIKTITDKKAKRIIEMRYFSGTKKTVSFKKISDELGISIQTAINWHEKIISLLRKKLTSKTICDNI